MMNEVDGMKPEEDTMSVYLTRVVNFRDSAGKTLRKA